jgi:hypothetical protein
MIQIQRHIGSSTNLRVWLKSLVTLYLMRLMALQEQVDLDDIDEDEVPTTAVRTMAIGDVRPQEQKRTGSTIFVNTGATPNSR